MASIRRWLSVAFGSFIGASFEAGASIVVFPSESTEQVGLVFLILLIANVFLITMLGRFFVRRAQRLREEKSRALQPGDVQ
ncbi:MAG: hypothetical protein OK442_00355 [Thaumarchaeota archaeon]|nr:hypothetical protein [Nitrososphaerota archaeon]